MAERKRFHVKTQASRRVRVTPAGGLEAGRAALGLGDWPAARLAFEASLQAGESAEALEGLGLAAWWLDLADVVFDVRERAYRIYRERGDSLAAARMAIWIAWDTAAFRGEHAIARGWLQRAQRLLETCPESTEHAWLALRRGIFALLDSGDPEAAEQLAAESIRIGQALGAVDYELVGRALHGFARVTAGSVAEGLQELDEVNAAVLAGEMSDRVLIALACCYLIAACERIRDYERAAQWCDRLKAFCRRWGMRPLFAVCRTQYASVCMWRGAWDEAERELTSAADELAACRPAMTGEGLVRLGELRRRQGKLDEAMSLFDSCGSHPLASLGRANVIFDRGDFKTSADLAERLLRRLPAKNRTERAAALELMIRASLEQDRVGEVAHAVAELDAIASQAQTGPLRALASLAAGLVAARSGDPESARPYLEDAVDLFNESGAPFETDQADISASWRRRWPGRQADGPRRVPAHEGAVQVHRQANQTWTWVDPTAGSRSRSRRSPGCSRSSESISVDVGDVRIFLELEGSPARAGIAAMAGAAGVRGSSPPEDTVDRHDGEPHRSRGHDRARTDPPPPAASPTARRCRRRRAPGGPGRPPGDGTPKGEGPHAGASPQLGRSGRRVSARRGGTAETRGCLCRRGDAGGCSGRQRRSNSPRGQLRCRDAGAQQGPGDRPGGGPHDHVGLARVPAHVVLKHGQDTRVVRLPDDTAGAQDQPNATHALDDGPLSRMGIGPSGLWATARDWAADSRPGPAFAAWPSPQPLALARLADAGEPTGGVPWKSRDDRRPRVAERPPHVGLVYWGAARALARRGATCRSSQRNWAQNTARRRWPPVRQRPLTAETTTTGVPQSATRTSSRWSTSAAGQ